MSKHPMQPIIMEADGIPRFKKNSIVDCIMQNISFKKSILNKLANDFSKEDIEQLSQLMGYPIAHYSGLDTSSEESVQIANRRVKYLLKRKDVNKVRVPKHPMQPIVWDGRGVIRFKKNAAVDYILDNGGIDLNQIAMGKFTIEDREQFNQLIGYSVSGYGDLSFIRRKTVRAADKKAAKLYESTNGEDPNVKID